MFAKDETRGPAARKGHILHLEKRNNVLVKSAVVLELVGEVENDVGREGFQFLPEQVEVVEDREMLCRITKRAERSQEVFLGFPILRFHLGAQILVNRRGPDSVEKREDFEVLLHVI